MRQIVRESETRHPALTFEQAIVCCKNGQPVRCKNWPESWYLKIDHLGDFHVVNGNSVSLENTFSLEWELADIIELESCPFCGKARLKMADAGSDPKLHYIRCMVCDAAGPMGETVESARARWNERERVIA